MLHVRALSYAYPGSLRPALQDVNLSVGRGEIFGIMGPAGSGKTTLMRILAGLIRDYAGTVSYLDRDYLAWSREFYESIGVCLDAPALFAKLSARENLTAFARMYRAGTEPVSLLLEKSGLTAMADLPIRSLNRGMRKRLDLARALLPGPQCLFTDEPLDGLENGEAGLVKSLLAGHKRSGRAVVLATSDASLIHGLCDRWISLADGRMTDMRNGVET